MGAHLIEGEFQSDKYPTTPRGKVPLSVKDETAQDLLWLYAQRRRAVDAEFADDLEHALVSAGYTGYQLRPLVIVDDADWRIDDCRKCHTKAMRWWRFCPACGQNMPAIANEVAGG